MAEEGRPRLRQVVLTATHPRVLVEFDSELLGLVYRSGASRRGTTPTRPGIRSACFVAPE